MNRIDYIVNWIKEYANTNDRKSLVVGISGGIDSAVVSTLCAKTNLPTHCLTMPITQISAQHNLSMRHGKWLSEQFSNVEHHIMPLDEVYKEFKTMFTPTFQTEHAFANTKSRLRMVTLHQISGSSDGIVVGTGNKVEDFGVGFYTKYGDGGVDISPIADCTKTEVWDIAKDLKILQDIIDAPPTDGLWEDGRTDKDQLGGLTYEQLEEAMTNQESEYYEDYMKLRKPNLHKMEPIPVCSMEKYR